jgi:hypothetical protein
VAQHMRRVSLRVLGLVGIVALALGALAAGVSHLAAPAAKAAPPASHGQSVCVAHHPQEYISYAAGCTGHDEPELDPLSDHPGSAQDIAWTVVLPTDGTTTVDQVGPTFWIGGTVTDPNSRFGQAFLELQFYPNSLIHNCAAGGGFNVSPARGIFTACSPVFELSKTGNSEAAAFNAMLTDSATGGPLVMHAGDTITDHQYVTPAADGMHITVTDLTTGHAGTIILNSQADGPLMPAFNVQKLGNALAWGIVDDAPNSLVWEIGHTSPFTQPASQFCLPGSATKPPCYSYNVPTWLGFHPLQVKGVRFGDGSTAQGWASVSDFGGKAEVDANCGAANFQTPFCWYPWYAFQSATKTFTFGGDYPGTTRDFGGALQFQQTRQCGGPFGPNSTYCATVLL